MNYGITNRTIPMVNDEKSLLDIWSYMLAQRQIFIFEPITDVLAQRVMTQLLYLDDKETAPITLNIFSPGGSVYACLAILGTMSTLKSKICTVVCGLAASAAAMIALSGDKGSRMALPGSRIMLHSVQTSGGGQTAFPDLRIQIKETSILNNELMKVISNCTKLGTIEDINQLMERDKYYDTKEAIEAGIIDSLCDRYDKRKILSDSFSSTHNKN